jgi:hypothetical protein
VKVIERTAKSYAHTYSIGRVADEAYSFDIHAVQGAAVSLANIDS